MPQDVPATKPTQTAGLRLWCRFWTHLFWRGVGAVRSLFGLLDSDTHTDDAKTKRKGPHLELLVFEDRCTTNDLSSALGVGALAGLINPLDLFGGNHKPFEQIAVVANAAPRVQLPGADRHPELGEPRREGVEPGDRKLQAQRQQPAQADEDDDLFRLAALLHPEALGRGDPRPFLGGGLGNGGGGGGNGGGGNGFGGGNWEPNGGGRPANGEGAQQQDNWDWPNFLPPPNGNGRTEGTPQYYSMSNPEDGQQQQQGENQTVPHQFDIDFGKLKRGFTENAGQWDSQVRFSSQGQGQTFFFTDDAVVLDLAGPRTKDDEGQYRQTNDVLKVGFVGGRDAVSPVGRGALQSRSNYFKGDREDWHSDVRQFSTVKYASLYEGIDLDFHAAHGTGRQAEFTYLVAAHADAGQIALSLDGAEDVRIDEDGNLVIGLSQGDLRFLAPTAYQDIGGQRQVVSVSFALLGEDQVGFQLGDYAHDHALTIDPIVSFSTLLGGSGDDVVNGVAVAPDGSVWVVGTTGSSDFPTTSGPYQTDQGGDDVFVAHYASDGQALLAATYLGGDSTDQGLGIAVGTNGYAYVTGSTDSTSAFFGDLFPLQGAFNNSASGTVAFVAAVAPAGNALLYSSFIGTGGSSGRAVDVDARGYAYVTGEVQSLLGNVPTVNAYQSGHGGGSSDAFLTVIRHLPTSGAATVVYGTFLGGGGIDVGYGVSVLPSGAAVVAGSTTGSFPVPGGVQTSYGGGSTDAFTARFTDALTTLAWAGYTGGSGADVAYGVDTDRDGNVYLAGATDSGNFPTRNAYQGSNAGGTEAFLTKIRSDGSTYTYSTYLGGGSTDAARGVAVAGDGSVWLAGYATGGAFTTPAFPTTAGALPFGGGGMSLFPDAFASHFSAAGSALLFSSPLGGSLNDSGNAIAVDRYGNAVVGGQTASSDFPTQDPLDGTLGGSTDGFVSKVIGTPFAALTTISSDSGASNTDRITNDPTLHLYGTATPNATVTLYREDQSTAIASFAATAGGTFSYDYTGTSLGEGVYNFKVRALSGGVLSTFSDPFRVTVDGTNPTVALTMDSSTSSFSPFVRVAAYDLLAGIGPSTTVTLDIDTDNNGSWDASQNATLVNGLALFHVNSLGSTGTRNFRARVDDLAGNTGTSATKTVTITSTASPWTPTAVLGTSGTDALQGDALSNNGSLTAYHGLDLDRSPGAGFGLVYTSEAASNKPVVAVQVTSDNAGALPGTIALTLVWDTGSGGTLATYTYNFSTTGYAPGDTFTLALQGRAGDATGRYRWHLDGSAGATTFALDGASFVVNRDAGQYGAGWSMAGVDSLVSIAADGPYGAGLLRLYGGGRYAFYEDAGGGTYTEPAGDNGALATSGGGWSYTTPDGRVANFNSSGLQTSAVSADGLSTITYSYTTGNLTGIQTPDGAVTTLTLSTGLTQKIETGSRAVTMTYSGTDLTTVQNPDNGLHTFTYASHKLTGEQFGVTQGTYAFDTYGLLSGATSGSGTDAVSSSLTPIAALGLGGLFRGTRYATTTDPSGAVWRSRLDNAGRLLESLAPNGAASSYGRDANGWVTVTTDALGRTTTFTLDAAGYTTQVTNPDATSRTYSYQASFHALTMTVDENGNVGTYAYDAGGHQIRATDALGRHTTMTYDSGTGNLLTVRDARNNVTTYSYDAFRRLETTTSADGGVVTLTYDTNGNVATRINARGYTTSFTNDALGRVLVAQTPDGALTTSTFDATGAVLTTRTPAGVTMASTFNTRGEVTKSTEGVGLGLERANLSQTDYLNRTSQSRDAAGNWSTSYRDAVGQTTHSQNALGISTGGNVYDLAGQLLASRNELGQLSTYAYDTRGRQTGSTNALGERTTSTFDNVGNRTVFQDANGNLTTTTYDALNRGFQVQTSSTQISTTTFDEVGNVRTSIDPGNKTTTYGYDTMNRRTTVTDTLGKTTTTAYDLNGNATSVTNPRNKTWTTVYDTMDRAYVTVSPDSERTTTTFDVSGVVTKVVNALNQTTTMMHDVLKQGIGMLNALNETTTQVLDVLGRAVAGIDAGGKVYQSLFDQLGRSVGGIDGLGNWTRNDFDGANRLYRSIDANGNATETVYDSLGRTSATVDSLGYRTTQTYDANGNLRTYRDASNNVTTFTYDSLNREIQRTDALGNSLTYAYDTRNRMSSQTDRLGRRKDWTYDDAGRVLTETWVNSGGGTANVLTYTYDDNGNLLTASDNQGTYTHTYDNQDRLSTQAGLYGVSFTFGYDTLGRRNWVEDSFGGVLSSVYDAANQLTKRQFGGAGLATLTYDLTYTASHEVATAKRYSDLSSSNKIGESAYTFDAAGRQTFIQHKNGAGTNIAAYTYTFDYGGRVTEELRNGTSVTYSYDTTSQLTSDNGTGYTYDSTGNRTMSGYTTGGMNQLTNDGTFTYTYDLEGNISTKSKGAGLEKWYYTWTNDNRAASVRKTSDGTTNTLTVTYTYDVFGHRIKEEKWLTGGSVTTTKFAYVGQEVAIDLTNANALLMRYVQGDTRDQMVARIDGSNNVAWFGTDRIGSVRDIMDAGGTVIDSITFTAWGDISSETNSANRGRYGAFGMEQDTDTQRLHADERDLDYKTARWDKPDPIWFRAGDSHLQRYVGNNPTNATDPSGLAEWRHSLTPSIRAYWRVGVDVNDWLAQQNQSVGGIVSFEPLTYSFKLPSGEDATLYADPGAMTFKNRAGIEEYIRTGIYLAYSGPNASKVRWIQFRNDIVVSGYSKTNQVIDWTKLPKTIRDGLRNPVSVRNAGDADVWKIDSLDPENPVYTSKGIGRVSTPTFSWMFDSPHGPAGETMIGEYLRANTDYPYAFITTEFDTYAFLDNKPIARVRWFSSVMWRRDKAKWSFWDASILDSSVRTIGIKYIGPPNATDAWGWQPKLNQDYEAQMKVLPNIPD